MPRAISGGAVKAQILDQFQPLLADFNGLEGLLGRGVHAGFVVELRDLLQHAVTDKAVDYHLPAAEEVIMDFRAMERCLVPNDHIVQHRFQVAQFNLHGGTVVRGDKAANFVLVGDVDVIHDDLFHTTIQVRDGLMENAVHQHHIQQLGATVHQVRHIDRNHAQLAVRDGSLPEGVQIVLVF